MAEQQLSKVIKIISFKCHDFVNRKSLITGTEVLYNYKLLRVKVKYKKGSLLIVKNIIVYPSDVIPYVRKTLDVIEEIVSCKIRKGMSYYEIEENYCKCDFGFSINSINSSIKRAKIAFNKLVTSMLVEGLNFSGWFINEKRDFVKLNTLYFNIFLSKEIEPSSLFR